MFQCKINALDWQMNKLMKIDLRCNRTEWFFVGLLLFTEAIVLYGWETVTYILSPLMPWTQTLPFYQMQNACLIGQRKSSKLLTRDEESEISLIFLVFFQLLRKSYFGINCPLLKWLR